MYREANSYLKAYLDISFHVNRLCFDALVYFVCTGFNRVFICFDSHFVIDPIGVLLNLPSAFIHQQIFMYIYTKLFVFTIVN